MDESRKQKPQGEKNELEEGPAWPQRPADPRPQPARPHLDPPDTPAQAKQGSGGFGDTEIQPSKWTSHPTSAGRQPGLRVDPGDTKETQVLPIVNADRFSNGRPAPAPQQARLSPPNPSQQAHPAQSNTPLSPSQGQPASRPQAIHRPQANAGQANGRQDSPGEYYDDYEPTRQYVVTPGDYDPYADDPYSNPYANPRRRPVPPPNRGKGAYAQYAEPAQAVEKRKPRWRWLLWTFTGIIAIAAIVAVAATLGWQGQYAGKIYPGVRVLGTDLGGKTQDEARKMLDSQVQAFLAQPVDLRWNGKDWRPSADQIGLKIDTAATVNQAFNVGRQADFAGNIEQQYTSWQTGYGVPLDMQFSEPALMTYLTSTVATETNQQLFDGDVRLNGTEVVALPGKEGRALDIYGAINAVRSSLAQLKAGTPIDMAVNVIQPTVSADEVAKVQQELTVRVSAPITATAPSGKTFTLAPDAIVRYTTIERNPDRNAPQHVTLGWQDDKLKASVADDWAQQASTPAQNAKFDWQNNQAVPVKASVDGYNVDPAAVVASIEQHAGTPDGRQYALPGQVVTPTISSKDINTLGIKEQIGQGVSTFIGSSAARATNIKVAAALLDGTVVAPGAEFSFLNTMGGIDEAQGFVPGYVIAAERTQLGVGGGVCQVSTTMFRAAFWAAMPITERNQHSYRVSWYEANGEPVGFDAAVFDPGVDLKFMNNTSGFVLIKAQTTTDTLTVTMYGTKTYSQVKLEGPVISNRTAPPPDVYEVDPRLAAGSKNQVETAHAGLDTLVTRRIIVSGQPDKTDQFFSSYKAWPNWYIVASPSQIPKGAQTH